MCASIHVRGRPALPVPERRSGRSRSAYPTFPPALSVQPPDLERNLSRISSNVRAELPGSDNGAFLGGGSPRRHFDADGAPADRRGSVIGEEKHGHHPGRMPPPHLRRRRSEGVLTGAVGLRVTTTSMRGGERLARGWVSATELARRTRTSAESVNERPRRVGFEVRCGSCPQAETLRALPLRDTKRVRKDG